MSLFRHQLPELCGAVDSARWRNIAICARVAHMSATVCWDKSRSLMRPLVVLAVAIGFAGAAMAQTSSPSTGGPTGGGPTTAAPPPSSSPPPATESQRNLDTRPPASSLPGSTTSPPPPAVLQPRTGTTETRPGQDAAPPSAGTGKRPTPGGAGSSQQSRDTRTGKNPGSETYTSCLNMWERATHMSRQEWSRACRRVENRLQNLQLSEDLDRLKTGSAATRRR